MPSYEWLFDNDLDVSSMPAKIRVLQTLNTPYPEGYDEYAVADLQAQAREVVESLKQQGIEAERLEDKEITAIIAYLQRLGTDIKPDVNATNQ